MEADVFDAIREADARDFLGDFHRCIVAENEEREERSTDADEDDTDDSERRSSGRRDIRG